MSLPDILRSLLSPQQADEPFAVFDYSLAETFQHLWAFPSINDRSIVVIWSRTASDPQLAPINAADALSPLDWAAGYVKQLGTEPVTWPQILVIDAAPEQHVGVPALAHFNTLRLDQLPWLTVLTFPNLPQILDWFGKRKQIVHPASYNKNCKIALKRFLREIRLNLTEVRSEGNFDRHSVSNIVAPMVLLDKAAKKTLHSEALLKLLKACGLCAEPPPLPQTARNAEVEVEEGKDLQILLIDDQANHGWRQWLQQVLPKAEIETLLDPTKLIDSIEQQIDRAKERDSNAKDLRFNLHLPKLQNATNPILFLDLRLFSGRPEAECRFYAAKLLPLIQEFANKAALAWPNFSLEDKVFNAAQRTIERGNLTLDNPNDKQSKGQRLEQWSTKFLESPAHHEALTWLPRLIALADMALPIIIFSSTTLRHISEKLRPFGNVITAFEKPRIASGGISRIAAADAVRSAVRTARNWNGPRASLHEVVKHVNSPSKRALDTSAAYHAVAYIDETGSSPNLEFGALVAIYPANCIEGDLDRRLTEWFGNDARSSRGKQWIRDNVDQILQQAHSLQMGVSMRFVRLRGGPQSFMFTSLEQSDELHDENVGDNLWRQMFRQIVEVAIYVVARMLACGEQVKSFSVRAPTRALPARSDALRRALWKRWGISYDSVGPDAALFDAIKVLSDSAAATKTFGQWWHGFIDLAGLLHTIPLRTPKQLLRYFNFDSARPLIEEIMKLYRNASYRPVADVVRAFPLNSHGTPQSRDIPVLHFVADALLSMDQIPSQLDVVEGEYGGRLEALLEFNRFNCSGDRVQALLSVAAEKPPQGLPLERLLLAEVGKAADFISGVEYAECANRWEERVLDVGEPLRGVVEGTRPGAPAVSRMIRADDGRAFFVHSCPLDPGIAVTFKGKRSNVPGGDFQAVDVRTIRTT